MRPSIAAVCFCLALGACCPATGPRIVEGSSPGELDPVTASFEDHIFVLSPLKTAVRDSAEYRSRLDDGYRHPKTLAHHGEEYVYIPARPSAEVNKGSHSYRLDRAKGEFSLTMDSEYEFLKHGEYFRTEEGWWYKSPFPNGYPLRQPVK